MIDSRAMAAARALAGTSELSLDAAITLWRNATTPEEKKVLANYVISNTRSWEGLLASVPTQAAQIWADAGKKSRKR